MLKSAELNTNDLLRKWTATKWRPIRDKSPAVLSECSFQVISLFIVRLCSECVIWIFCTENSDLYGTCCPKIGSKVSFCNTGPSPKCSKYILLWGSGVQSYFLYKIYIIFEKNTWETKQDTLTIKLYNTEYSIMWVWEPIHTYVQYKWNYERELLQNGAQ